jgi:alpha-methylacyl-CoA racemase
LPAQHDRNGWPVLRERFAAAFGTRTRDEWAAVFADSDACVAPVLTFSESRRHPQVVARDGSITLGGIEQPAPAPRFDRTPGAARRPPPERGEGGLEALRDWGFAAAASEALGQLGLGWRP